MRVNEDNDHFMHCHSATSCITTSFIRVHLTHKRSSINHKRQWARIENQKGVLHCCFFSQLLAPLNNIKFTSALYCHLFFYPFPFHYRLYLYLGPEVQCLGMLLKALVWRNPKAVLHLYSIFIILSIGQLFCFCLSEKAGVCMWVCTYTSVHMCTCNEDAQSKISMLYQLLKI